MIRADTTDHRMYRMQEADVLHPAAGLMRQEQTFFLLMYTTAGVKGSRARRVTAPLSLTLHQKERGREQLSSQRTEAAMSEK